MDEVLAGIDIPDLTAFETIEINMSGDGSFQMSEDLLALMQSSDVTTITKNSKILSEQMFDIMTPGVIANIQTGITSGIEAMQASLEEMNASIAQMQSVVDTTGKGGEAIESMKAVIPQIEDTFQKTLNIGFRQVFLTVTIASSIAFIILIFYRKKKSQIIE